MNPVETVLAHLEGVKKNDNGYQARCPAHEDHKPSLSVTEGEDGRALVHCHAGCEPEAVLAALHLEARDLFAEEKQAEADADTWTPRGRAVASYPYTDETGRLLFAVCRTAGKDFPAWRPDPTAKHGKAWNLTEVRRVPYRLARVIEEAGRGGVVYVVEGEKDAESLGAIGSVATCNPGGAGRWQAKYAEYLRGAHVIVEAKAGRGARG